MWGQQCQKRVEVRPWMCAVTALAVGLAGATVEASTIPVPPDEGTFQARKVVFDEFDPLGSGPNEPLGWDGPGDLFSDVDDRFAQTTDLEYEFQLKNYIDDEPFKDVWVDVFHNESFPGLDNLIAFREGTEDGVTWNSEDDPDRFTDVHHVIGKGQPETDFELRSRFYWRQYPNPDWERFLVNAEMFEAADVGRVDIVTISVPSPSAAAAGLVMLTGLALGRPGRGRRHERVAT